MQLNYRCSQIFRAVLFFNSLTALFKILCTKIFGWYAMRKMILCVTFLGNLFNSTLGRFVPYESFQSLYIHIYIYQRSIHVTYKIVQFKKIIHLNPIFKFLYKYFWRNYENRIETQCTFWVDANNCCWFIGGIKSNDYQMDLKPPNLITRNKFIEFSLSNWPVLLKGKIWAVIML